MGDGRRGGRGPADKNKKSGQRRHYNKSAPQGSEAWVGG